MERMERMERLERLELLCPQRPGPRKHLSPCLPRQQSVHAGVHASLLWSLTKATAAAS